MKAERRDEKETENRKRQRATSIGRLSRTRSAHCAASAAAASAAAAHSPPAPPPPQSRCGESIRRNELSAVARGLLLLPPLPPSSSLPPPPGRCSSAVRDSWSDGAAVAAPPLASEGTRPAAKRGLWGCRKGDGHVPAAGGLGRMHVVTVCRGQPVAQSQAVQS